MPHAVALASPAATPSAINWPGVSLASQHHVADRRADYAANSSMSSSVELTECRDMAAREVKRDSKIAIIGAGVFGLSTTLHLLKQGYTNIHIFDKQRFDRNHYSEDNGADGASCDLNTRLFQWRHVPDGKRNGLEEGPEGWRTLDRQQMAGNDQWHATGSSSSKL